MLPPQFQSNALFAIAAGLADVSLGMACVRDTTRAKRRTVVLILLVDQSDIVVAARCSRRQ